MSDASTPDRLAIQDVMLNYAAGVDERDIERYGACFTDDVEIIGFGSETYNGRNTWLDYVWSALEKYTATQHMLGPVYATIDGDRASARTDVQATHFLVDDGGRFTLWATYITQLEKSDSRWLIRRHELKVCGTQTDG